MLRVILKDLRTSGRNLLLNGLVNGSLWPRSLRSRAWKHFGHDIDVTASMNPGSFLGARHGLQVGRKSFINYNCFFDLAAPTSIGQNCEIGYEVRFITATHEIGSGARRAGASRALPISIGDGCWIGAGVTFLPGVTVGRGTVIAAGSTVTSDCHENSLYAGSPARFKRALSIGNL